MRISTTERHNIESSGIFKKRHIITIRNAKTDARIDHLYEVLDLI